MKLIGLMAFFLIGSVLINSLLQVLNEPAVVDVIRDLSPALANNLMETTLAAAVLLALAVIAIPPMVMSKERQMAKSNGQTGSAFETLGFGTCIVVTVVAIGYLLGVGWVAATASI